MPISPTDDYTKLAAELDRIDIERNTIDYRQFRRYMPLYMKRNIGNPQYLELSREFDNRFNQQKEIRITDGDKVVIVLPAPEAEIPLFNDVRNNGIDLTESFVKANNRLAKDALDSTSKFTGYQVRCALRKLIERDKEYYQKLIKDSQQIRFVDSSVKEIDDDDESIDIDLTFE